MLKNKKGNIILLYMSVIICLFLPLTAVIYDVGMYRVAKQDVKNLQEIAGLACVGASNGSLGNTGAAQQAGGFNKQKCESIVKDVVAKNMDNSKIGTGATANFTPKFRQAIKSERNNSKGSKFIDATNLQVRAVGERDGGMILKIQGMRYKPTFLKTSLMNINILKNKKSVNYDASWPIEVSPSHFSAVYDATPG